MQVQILEPLVTMRAPKAAETPWLTGRGARSQLVQDFVVEIDRVIWRVPAGYVFDGASIPWWLWWAFPPNYEPAWQAAAFHDRCYSHWYLPHVNDGVWRQGVTKQFADDAFEAIMLADGAPPKVASLFHWAVKRFGRGGW